VAAVAAPEDEEGEREERGGWRSERQLESERGDDDLKEDELTHLNIEHTLSCCGSSRRRN